MRREHWSGKLVFILAASGSAVGLGNLWKFPYITYDNGGGLFILIYLACIVLIGLPIMISEIAMGKISAQNPVGAFRVLGGPSSPFRQVGALGVFSAFLILSYYSVVAGWGIEYSLKSINRDFARVPADEKAQLLKTEAAQTSLKKQALKDGLASQLSDMNRAKILTDAGLITGGDVSAEESALLYQQNRSRLSSLLEANGKAVYWSEEFLRLRQSQSDYAQWEEQALLPAYSSKMFNDFLDNHGKVLAYHLVFMLFTAFIVARGIKAGIEKAIRLFMPLLFVIILILMVNSLMLDNEQEAVRFMLYGQPEKFKVRSILEALGHSFFTLSLGMGAMMTYGSYMPKNSDIIKDSLWVVGMDTLVALMACLMIFPIIFVYGMTPTGSGIGILFTTLPLEFFKFPGGAWLSLLFYLLVLVAAVTSAISLLEVPVAYLVDEWKFSRKKATVVVSSSALVLGIPSALSVGGFLTFADLLATNLFLPLGGLLISIFLGYRADINLIKEEFNRFHYPEAVYTVYKFSIRVLTPVLLVLVAIHLLYSMAVQ